ncbi:hypothetical protein [Spodoptera frugiperda rhabdovirus]|uniref:Uncharacterized protein n=1 Tax=Spodoptera frugiperda rhabdovirus TaxID=1481139 RepID=X2KYE6_9RHAB|nr:hypothetical protein [Spodoptera frugiperda rhabdovirus]AHN92648.1 hypothetical protein [Spodoptera frugiperda rhabdovirus]WKD80970.1 putative X [Spodoptera frugiperda rhabdovirus]
MDLTLDTMRHIETLINSHLELEDLKSLITDTCLIHSRDLYNPFLYIICFVKPTITASAENFMIGKLKKIIIPFWDVVDVTRCKRIICTEFAPDDVILMKLTPVISYHSA